MRDIKFRAWDHGRMVHELAIASEEADLNTNLSAYNELMQFTGLKDKNGRDVYEGDIYRNGDNGLIGKLTFAYPGERLLYGTEYKDGRIYNNQPFHCYDTTNFEVIGNLYEDSNLLKLAA